MIVESEQEFQIVKQSVESGDSFWIPVYSDPYRHYTDNELSFIYIYSITDDQDFVISFRHTDCISLQRERLTELISRHDIFVLAKKRLRQIYPNTCIDADFVAWWQTHKMLPLDDTNTQAHDVWSRWWHNETNINDWLPITKHIERCIEMRNKFMHVYKTFSKTAAFEVYERLIIDTCNGIERSGLQVNSNIFQKYFKSAVPNNVVHTEYNIYTITGRPSNKFNGVNYAALNKDDGCRAAFVSRHNRGILLEMDFDAYHVRLIADLINYQLPNSSVHEYFGRQYFAKQQLNESEYEESKQITFRLLYGGIDDDFAKIPYFGKVRTFIRTLWNEFKSKGVIYTPIMHRPMYAAHLPDMNPNKLFNYVLQATETERNLQLLSIVLDHLLQCDSKLILYTYDSLLFDFSLSDGGHTIDKLIGIISDNNKYPVKIKAGLDYNSMKIMNR